jgi:hypothetical protein
MAFWHDVAHSLLHFDGKIWRTLPLLTFRPGELTRRYVAGERARFVSPMALFLFAVFLMFAVFSTVGGPFRSPTIVTNPAAQRQMQAEVTGASESLAELRRERAAAAAQGDKIAGLDMRIAEAERRVGTATVIANGFDSEGVTIEGMPGDDWFNAAYKKAKQNPALLFYKLQSNAYKFSWALIPISVPFLWLLFAFRRRYKAYDHMVFVTYSLSFMTLFAIALALLATIGMWTGLAVLALTIVPPIHMYRQLRDAYQLSRFGAVWRTLCLVLFALLAVLLFFLLLVGIGISD